MKKLGLLFALLIGTVYFSPLISHAQLGGSNPLPANLIIKKDDVVVDGNGRIINFISASDITFDEQWDVTLPSGGGGSGSGSSTLTGLNDVNTTGGYLAGNILVADGTKFDMIQLSGDITMTSSGATSLDTNISPTWTGTHTFNSQITVGGSSERVSGTTSYIDFDDLGNDTITLSATHTTITGDVTVLGDLTLNTIMYFESGSSIEETSDGHIKLCSNNAAPNDVCFNFDLGKTWQWGTTLSTTGGSAQVIRYGSGAMMANDTQLLFGNSSGTGVVFDSGDDEALRIYSSNDSAGRGSGHFLFSLQGAGLATPANALETTDWATIVLQDASGTWGNDMRLRHNGDTGYIWSGKGGITLDTSVIMTGDVTVPTEVYGASWDGVFEAPTKDALYDKIETIGGGGGSGSTTLTGLTDVNSSGPYTAGNLIIADGTIFDSLALSGDVTLDVNGVTAINDTTYTAAAYAHNAFNGTVLHSFDATFVQNGGEVDVQVERSGGGDLIVQFSDGLTTIDCTPICTLQVDDGTDAAPNEAYVYITKASKILEYSTTDWPSGEHAKITYALVPTDTYVNSNGVYINQNWNDHVTDTKGSGHITHMGERLRYLNAIYHSGVSGAGDGGTYVLRTDASPDTVYIATSSGVVMQMHRHTWVAKDTSGSDAFLVVNSSVSAYEAGSDLYDFLVDADGDALSGNPSRYYNLVLWGAANKGGTFDPIMVNLPTCNYTTQADAEGDVSACDVYSIPSYFMQESSTGFLIARLTMKWTNSGSDLELISTVDLRGTTPQSVSGGGGSSHDPVTLAGTPDYITISGQIITRNDVDLTADVTGTLPHENGGLEADVSAYDGLINITGGATSNLSPTTTQIIIGDGSGVPTLAAISGDATMTSAGVLSLATGSVDSNELVSTAVTPGSYTNSSLTVDADGRLTAASSGSVSGVTIPFYKGITIESPVSLDSFAIFTSRNAITLTRVDATIHSSGTVYGDFYQNKLNNILNTPLIINGVGGDFSTDLSVTSLTTDDTLTSYLTTVEGDVTWVNLQIYGTYN